MKNIVFTALIPYRVLVNWIHVGSLHYVTSKFGHSMQNIGCLYKGQRHVNNEASDWSRVCSLREELQ